VINPTTCPPVVSRSTLLGSVDAAGATLDGASTYWTGALARGAMPWDVAGDAARWWSAMTVRERPRWSTPNEVVWESPIMRLRDFTHGATDDVVPTLVLPPQAGHSSSIVDYSPRQSQMQTIRAAGLTRALSLDWIGATQATKHATVDDFLADIAHAVELIGSPVNLVGDCQGGWLAAIYAALHPERIHTLTIAGAPIDFHAGDPVIGGYVELFEPSFYAALVASGGGVLPGSYQLGGFIAIKPQDEVARQWGLLNHLDDAEHVERYRHFEDWFKHTQDIAGDFYLWIVEHLFRRNALVSRKLEIGGERVELGNISCPLMLLAGSGDHITPPPQVFAAREHVATPAEDVVQRTASGGHLGLFMGREALRDHWPPVLAEVYARSTPGAVSRERAVRESRARTDPGRAAPQPIP